MRLWTLHPKYLDARGLVALWREALLAQKVLQGKTEGYRHHSQLIRFQSQTRPAAAIAAYLVAILDEANRRGYHFNAAKIPSVRIRITLPESQGQVLYEWRHLKRKLRRRDYQKYLQVRSLHVPDPHPLFRIVPGPVQAWEKIH
jgi:hypothetical protein